MLRASVLCRVKFAAWSIDNWVKGYQFRPVKRFRCCSHTWPYHARGCAAERLAIVADETGGTTTADPPTTGNEPNEAQRGHSHAHNIGPDPAGAHSQSAPPVAVEFAHVTQWAALTASGIQTFETREQALAAYAEDEPETPDEAAPEGVLPARWEGTLILEGVRTDDFREIAPNALEWRELPLPLMYQEATDWGHDQSVMAGSIEAISRKDDGRIWGEGPFDLDGDAGKEAARQMGAGFLRWVSGDVAVTAWEMIEEGDCDLEDILWGGGEDCVIVERVTEGRIMGATLVYFPAFEDATLEPVFADNSKHTELALVAAASRPDNEHLVRSHPLELTQTNDLPALVAAAQASTPAVSAEVDASWFEDPKLADPTPLTITNDGRVFGHIAVWEDEQGRPACHIGFPDECVPVPHSATGYAFYQTGGEPVACQDCGVVGVGQLTVGTGHADTALGYRDAVAHYDNTGHAVADLRAGEDAFGVWVAGAVRPTATPAQIAEARASSPSGDWRNVGGNLEMVAVLAVNVPGYPVVRTRVASGQMQTLVASVGPRRMSAGTFEQRLDKLGAAVRKQGQMLAALRPAIVASLQARIKAGKPENQEAPTG